MCQQVSTHIKKNIFFSVNNAKIFNGDQLIHCDLEILEMKFWYFLWLIGKGSKKLAIHLFFPAEDGWCRLMNNSIQNFHQNYSLINNYLQIAFGSAPCFTMRRKNSKQSEPLQEYQQGGHFSWDDVRTHYIPNNKRFWKVPQRERIPDPPGGMFR